MVSVWVTASTKLRILILSSFLMSLGFYSLMPFLALHFTTQCKWTITMAGLLLATRQFSQQGLTFIGGMLADSIGWHKTLTAGIWIRAIGFLTFAISSRPEIAFLAASLSGIGGALFEPSYKMAYDANIPTTSRAHLLAFREVVASLALGASALLGTVLLGVEFTTLAILSGMIYAVVALIIGFSDIRFQNKNVTQRVLSSMLGEMIQVATHRSFLIYTLLLISYYYLVTQLYFSVPQAIIQATGDERSVPLFYGVISVTIILFQLQASRWISGQIGRFRLIGLGTLIVGLSLALLSMAHHPCEILLLGVLFSIGTMIASPLIVEVVPIFTQPERLGAYYGFNSTAIAIGGVLSAGMGGWLFDFGKELGIPSLPWIVCLVLAIVSCVGLFIFERHALEGSPYSFNTRD